MTQLPNENPPAAYLLDVENVVKQYQGVTALDGVNLKVGQSEIHALLGGNGAGKSTIINVLSGVTVPDAGSIKLAREKINIRRPSDALGYGITTIHQELSLVPALTTLDNIFLGREMNSRILGLNMKLDRRAMQEKVHTLAAEFGLSREDLQLPIEEFGALKKRVVEIVKALAFDARVLILDEPTSGLEEEERLNLFGHMRKLRDRGVSLIWVTHHLEEIFGLADKATVFRDGKDVGNVSVSETTVDQLLEMMFGVAAVEFGATDRDTPHADSIGAAGEEILRVSGVNRGHVLKDISLSVRQGEILGISGLAGAGRTELARAIMGIDKISSGSIHLNGRPVRLRNSSAAYRHGLAMLPEDRKQLGILPEFSVAENISLASLPSVSKFGFVINGRNEEKQADDYRKRLAIRTPGVKEKIRNLSGGNQQKAIVARCLNTKPTLLIFDEPTQGIDVSAKVEVHNLIRDFVRNGGAAIVIASEIAELVELSHRVVVMKKGRLVGSVENLPEALAKGRLESVKHKLLALSAGRTES
ncbi:sugar ABC transporter ATP-binding protein [Arthrobacter tecti]